MKKRTKFYALLFAMVLSLTQMIGAAVPVKAATKECSHGYTLVNGIGIRMHECGESVCITKTNRQNPKPDQNHMEESKM